MDVIPGAERVRVFEAEPKGCIYIGEVSSIQEDETVGTLDTAMDLATRIDLRNKAHKLGANVIVFSKGKITNALPGSKPNPVIAAEKKNSPPAAPSPDGSNAQVDLDEDTLIFLATAFKCPSSVLNQ